MLTTVAAACSGEINPLEDPGLGDLGLTSVVLAADGSVIAEWHAEEDRVLVEYADLPGHLVDAVVAIEDERFWDHPGVDLRAIARALVTNAEAESIEEGGSTITQQYIKNVVLTPDVSLERKIEEAQLAVRLEETLTKEEIFERYANTIYLGDGAYGVGSAAAHYFGKQVGDLTVGESALIAGLIKNPSRWNPFADTDASLGRRRVVLEAMTRNGLITPEQAEAADAEPLALVEQAPPLVDRYPYFSEVVKQALLDDETLGLTPTDRYNAIFRGGLTIQTTLDPAIQEAAQQAVANVLPEDGPSGAVAVIEPSTGEVRALVGGRDFYDPDDPVARFNLATQGRRQPGSAFKPFVLAAALEGSFSLQSVFARGAGITIDTDGGPWTVTNYENQAFPDMTLLDATRFSVNKVYAELVDAVGPAEVVEVAHAAGITSELEPFHSVALGAQEVTVLEMASAYGTFAFDGLHLSPTLVTSIETRDGTEVWRRVPVVTEALSADVAQQVTAALTEVVRAGTGIQASIGRPAAGKTGTTQNHNDAWFVGFTPELVAAVWVGFPEGQVPMEPPTTEFPVTGGTWPAEIWAAFMPAALADAPFGSLAQIEAGSTVRVDVDTSTGYLAGPLCPREHVVTLELAIENAPTVVCPIHNPNAVVAAGSLEVPNALGTTIEDAVAVLQGAGFSVVTLWEPLDGTPSGTVWDQVPEPGAPARAGAAVTIKVDAHEPGTVVPSLLGFPQDEAERRLADLGTEFITIVQAESDTVEAAEHAGTVWAQEPPPLAPLTDSVTIWVNP